MSRRSSFRSLGDGRSRAGQIGRRGFTLVEFLVVLGIIALLVALLMPGQSRSRVAARRTQCRNNLKQIGLALHNYHDLYGQFPPAYTVDADGRPLHSWRTLILPYIDQQELYWKIDLSKPWDDPVNAEAAATVVPAFVCPSAVLEPTHTAYLAVVTSDSCLRPLKSLPLSEITDGTSNTILVLEVPVKDTVPWMSPHDVDLQFVVTSKPEEDLHHTGGNHALFVDASVRFLSSETPPETLRAMTSAARGEVVEEY